MRAAWLEADEEFEGVGAHPNNPRYDPVDEGDEPVHPRGISALPGLHRAQTLFHGLRGFADVTGTQMGETTLTHRLDMHDGSHYQIDAGPVQWAQLRAATKSIAWKMSQSNRYVDPTFKQVRMLAGQYGFERRLFYHWLSSVTDPAEQAQHVLRTIAGLGNREGLMLDAEEGGITVDKCLALMEAVEAVTHLPFVVYTGLYVAGGAIWRDPRIRMSKYGPRPMILAAYITVDSLISRLKSLGLTGLPIHGWQWSSNGPVPGITGRADMNAIFDTPAFNVACGLKATTPTDPVPVQEDEEMLVCNNAPMTWGDQEYGVDQVWFSTMPDGTLRHVDDWNEVLVRCNGDPVAKAVTAPYRRDNAWLLGMAPWKADTPLTPATGETEPRMYHGILRIASVPGDATLEITQSG